MTGEEQTCMLADGSRVKVPMAVIYVNTPYFVGKAEAWCMENPMYDLIIGNVRGARDPNNLDDKWKVNAVQTRQQVKNKQRPYPPLKVPEAVKDINPDDIKSEQQREITLKKIRMLAQEGKSLTGKGDAIVAYVEKNGLLYRKFQSQKVQNGKEFTQLVVPMRYRNVVLKMAHESILARHMSTARTISRVLSEFFLARRPI